MSPLYRAAPKRHTLETVDEKPKCTAVARSTGKRCQRNAEPNSSFCILASHRGEGGDRTLCVNAVKHGRFGGLPERMRASLEAARGNRDTLELMTNIAAMCAVSDRLAERVNEKDAPEFRDKARRLYADVLDTLHKIEGGTAIELLRPLGEWLDQGCAEDSALERFSRSCSRVQSHVEAAWKIRLSGQQVINANDLATQVVVLVQEFKTACLIEGLSEEQAGRIVERVVRRSQKAGVEFEARAVEIE